MSSSSYYWMFHHPLCPHLHCQRGAHALPAEQTSLHHHHQQVPERTGTGTTSHSDKTVALGSVVRPYPLDPLATVRTVKKWSGGYVPVERTGPLDIAAAAAAAVGTGTGSDSRRRTAAGTGTGIAARRRRRSSR